MAEVGVRDAVGLVADEVRELVRRGRLDPAREPEQVRRLVEEVVADYDERALTSDLPPLLDRRRTAGQVWDAVAGYGPLQRHLDDPEIEEVWVNDRLTHGCRLRYSSPNHIGPFRTMERRRRRKQPG